MFVLKEEVFMEFREYLNNVKKVNNKVLILSAIFMVLCTLSLIFLILLSNGEVIFLVGAILSLGTMSIVAIIQFIFGIILIIKTFVEIEKDTMIYKIMSVLSLLTLGLLGNIVLFFVINNDLKK